VDELDAERGQVDDVAGLDLVQDRVAKELVVLELVAHQPEGHPGAVDRPVEAADHKRQRADVVLVAVGQHDRLDLVGVLHQVADVRDHQVDAQHLLLRKHQPGVDNQDPAVVLDRHHVDADLPEAAEGYHPQKRDSCSLGSESEAAGATAARLASISAM
jgi:hypothetical protein